MHPRRLVAASLALLGTALLAGSAAAQRPTPRPARPAPAPGPAVRDSSAARSAGRDTARVRVTGVVTDSVAGGALGGAVVQMVRADDATTALAATADSAGAFAFPGVAPGRYVIGFLHPRVDALGIEPPTQLLELVAGQPAELALSTPSPVRLRAALCRDGGADSSGALVGVVRDADRGTAIAGAKVILTWRQIVFDEAGVRMAERRAPATAGADGAYLVCGLPSDVEAIASAEAPGRMTGLIEVRVPPRGLLYRDLTLGDSVSAAPVAIVDSAVAGSPARRRTVRRGTAKLTGTVRDPESRPLAGATVVVLGTAATGRTGADGRFALSDLPAGTQAVEARAIGFSPGRAAVDLASAAPARAELRLTRPPTTLSAVVVEGKRTARTRNLEDFTRRKRSGFGRFVTGEDLERQRPIYVTDALRTIPGMRVTPNARGFGQTVTGRANCTPTVYIDGMKMYGGATDLDAILRPGDVAGIEIYSGPSGKPPQFEGDCVIAVWSK